MLRFAVAMVALTFATTSASGQSTEPMNKFVEACALWTSDRSEEPGSYTVEGWTQRHRVVTILFAEFDKSLMCEFRDLQDEVPEVVSVSIGRVEDPVAVTILNASIWDHFVLSY